MASLGQYGHVLAMFLICALQVRYPIHELHSKLEVEMLADLGYFIY